ncbi:hypothetical protein HUJ05_004750 [Dendroctonus ponderosae]|nr:hypothetical protein HUJ05_004750 [Dendroctonus ponderosae]KAH1010458.1 hypothetical protein HUJ05_004750 [Dendroctonus ponderosae]
MAQYVNQETVRCLKEWAPLTHLYDKLPSKTGGLFSQDIKLTCIDALSQFLVIGTNVGVVFWYDRKTTNLQRLRCENSTSPIRVVKAVSTVDYMVACGNKEGGITIFQIPKSHPEALPESLKPQQKQVERYTVADLHNSPITALEWSKNGIKLFSGDKAGSIVLTEIDFYLHVCKSLEILNESYEVVQLSYRQQNLLISTTFRSIVCQYSDKWKVCQVGKKDRKVLGKFGGLIYQHGYTAQDVILYTARPGLRIWIADVVGQVHKTLLFKDLLCKDCPQVPVLNPISKALQSRKPQKEAAFGMVQQFCDNLLVSHSNDVVYILDPHSMNVLATVNNLRRAICKAEEAQETLRVEGRTFDEISNQEFDESILFKNAKKTKKKPPKINERKSPDFVPNNGVADNLSFTRSTLMNLSTIGVMPDLRSPESITKDIKQKEKILSNVLNLEELSFSLEHDVQAEPHTKETSHQIINLPFHGNVENRIQFEKTRDFKSRQSPEVFSEVVHVPNDWNIANIQLPNLDSNSAMAPSNNIPIVRQKKNSSSTNDSSLSDWEIV